MFQKGQSGNPNGRPVVPYVPYGERAKYLLNLYSADGILELLADRKAFGKLPVRDAILIRQLGESIAGSDARLEREALLDRIEGKASQSIDVTGQIGIVQIVMQAVQQDKPTEVLSADRGTVLEHDQTTLVSPVIGSKHTQKTTVGK